MRTAYRVLAYLVAIEVVVQAGAIAWAYFGLGKWIEDGGVLDKATMESEGDGFPEVLGFIVHGINGQMVVPLLALILLVVSFFAQVPKGVQWAGSVFGLVALQVLLGTFAHGIPALGLLHGFNALALFTVAVIAGRRAIVARTESDAGIRAGVA